MTTDTFTIAGLTLALPALPDGAHLTGYLWDADLKNSLDMDRAELESAFSEEFDEAVTVEFVAPLHRDDDRRLHASTGLVLVLIKRGGTVLAGWVATRPNSYCDTPYRLTELDEWNYSHKPAKPAKRKPAKRKPAKRKKLTAKS